MSIYLLRNGAVASDLKRRADGCLLVHRFDLGCGCWVPPGFIRGRLSTSQVARLMGQGYIPDRVPGT